MTASTNPKFIMQYAVKEEAVTSLVKRMIFQAESGFGEMYLLEVYPGVQMWSIDFHLRELDIKPMGAYRCLKLNYYGTI